MFDTPTTVTFRSRLDSSVRTHGKFEAIIFVFNLHLRLCVLGAQVQGKDNKTTTPLYQRY